MDKAWRFQCSLFFFADDDIDFGELKWGNVLVLVLHKMPKSRHLFSWAKVLLRYSKRKIRAVLPFQHSHFWYLCLGRQCSSPRRATNLSCSPKLMRNSAIYVGSCYLYWWGRATEPQEGQAHFFDEIPAQNGRESLEFCAELYILETLFPHRWPL
jgi:hypothetical protein